MSENTLQELQKDIRDLYCMTKESSVEDLLVIVAASVNETYAAAFQKSKAFASNSVKDPVVVEALDALFKLSKRLPENASPSDVWNLFFRDKGRGAVKAAHYLPHFYAFSQALNAGVAVDLLSPFGVVLDAASKMRPEDAGVDVGSVVSDLSTIETIVNEEQQRVERSPLKDSYPMSRRPRKPTIKEQKTMLFSYLLREISTMLAEVAERNDLLPLAQKLREGALMSPSQLKMVFNYGSPSSFSQDKAKGVVDEITKKGQGGLISHPSFKNWAYNFVVASGLHYGYYLTLDQLMDIYGSKEATPHSLNYMSEEMEETGILPEEEISHEVERISAEDSQLLSPDVLLFFTTFFYLFHQQII